MDCCACYRIDTIGPYGSSSDHTVHGRIIVKIVDAFLAGHANVYYETKMPPDERCTSNLIDIGTCRKLTDGDIGCGMYFCPGQPSLAFISALMYDVILF